jgi:hypothetical protein
MTSVTVTTSSTEILAHAKSRKFFALYNNGASTVYLAFDGTSAATTAAGFPLAAGASLIIHNNGPNAYLGPVYGIAASGTVDVRTQQAG